MIAQQQHAQQEWREQNTWYRRQWVSREMAPAGLVVAPTAPRTPRKVRVPPIEVEPQRLALVGCRGSTGAGE